MPNGSMHTTELVPDLKEMTLSTEVDFFHFKQV